MKKKICVLGLGYIGLPTALLLAQNFSVIGVDINKQIVDDLQNNNLPFEEKGLEELFNRVKNNFFPSSKIEPADVFLIAVPTPLEESLKIADLQYIQTAAEMISPYLEKGNLVILESTVPPCTSENLILPILEKNGLKKTEFFYAHCPERAIPGNTLYEMINNDRIIGGLTKNCRQKAKEIYETFVKGELLLTGIKTAEFVKLMENTSRDVNIALANEFAKIAAEMHLNIWEAIDFANRHPRVNVLQPGPGVGGHCIAIDPWFLTESSTKSQMISLARQINDSMPNYVFQLIKEIVNNIINPIITIFGVSYKKNVDDWRATPTLRLIRLIENEGWTVKLFDPYVRNFPKPILTLNESVKESNCIVIMTDHDIFQTIDPNVITVRTKNIIDTRNSLNVEKWEDCGFFIKILGDGSKKLY